VLTHNKVIAYLRPDQKAALDKLSEKTGAPVAELIRRGVDLLLKKASKEIK
jgi:hypothetical protein